MMEADDARWLAAGRGDDPQAQHLVHGLRHRPDPVGGDRDHRAGLRHAGGQHIRARPCKPKTNGKARHFIQTALRKRVYTQAYVHSGGCAGPIATTGTSHMGT